MQPSPIKPKTVSFALRIIKLYKYLTDEKREFVISRQILRSGTSIGANVSEAEYAQTKPDYLTKMTISLKEASETCYWLLLLKESKYITENQFISINDDAEELVKMLTSICKSTRQSIESKKQDKGQKESL